MAFRRVLNGSGHSLDSRRWGSNTVGNVYGMVFAGFFDDFPMDFLFSLIWLCGSAGAGGWGLPTPAIKRCPSVQASAATRRIPLIADRCRFGNRGVGGFCSQPPSPQNVLFSLRMRRLPPLHWPPGSAGVTLELRPVDLCI